MEFEYRLYSYRYYTYCQGSRDTNYGMNLLYVPNDIGISLIRGLLIQDNPDIEIDIKSITNLTIKF